jgi:hypothetical protein
MTDPILVIEPGFSLSSQERHSALWKRLEAYFAQRLAKLRADNDRPQTEMQTAQLRGHIACLKQIIRLGEEPPPADGIVPATAMPRVG